MGLIALTISLVGLGLFCTSSSVLSVKPDSLLEDETLFPERIFHQDTPEDDTRLSPGRKGSSSSTHWYPFDNPPDHIVDNWMLRQPRMWFKRGENGNGIMLDVGDFVMNGAQSGGGGGGGSLLSKGDFQVKSFVMKNPSVFNKVGGMMRNSG